MTTALLSSYPLSSETFARIGGRQGRQLLTLSELRLLPVARLLRALRGVQAETLRVVVQEPSERAVLPLMLLLAALTRSGGIEVHDLQAGTTRAVHRLRAALGILGTVSATLGGAAAIAHLHFTARRLLRMPAHAHGRLTGLKALYLKSNLMLGVKAGGSIGHIAGVVNELAALAPDELVLAPEPPPMVRPGVRYAAIPTLSAYGVPAEANHFRFNRLCVQAGRTALSAERFDFIYQRLSLGNLSGVLLARHFRLPLVLEYNGSEVWISDHWGHKLKNRRLAAMIEDVCLRHAHRVVTVSEVLADELAQRGVPRERIVWYPNGIDPELFDPARHRPAREALRQRLGIGAAEVAVLFLGTFGVWHGAEVLAEAAERHLADPASRPGRRLRFVFVGDGLRLPAIRERLAPHIASGEVILTGLVPQGQAPEYLAAADVFVSPHVPSTDGTRFFGSPTKLFEYMAMERPVVASALEQIADVLTPAVHERELAQGIPAGATAVLTEPGSANSLLRALHHLRDHPADGRQLAQAARARALAEYTWRRHVGVIVDSLR